MWSPTTSSDELYHHGIQGQRWGKRNGPPYPLDSSDYSQTERKYRTDKGHYKNTEKKNHKTGNKENNTKAPKKSVDHMSNNELKMMIDRKQLEQRYTELEDQQISRGRQKVMSYVRDYATVAAAVLTTAKLIDLARKNIGG